MSSYSWQAQSPAESGDESTAKAEHSFSVTFSPGAGESVSPAPGSLNDAHIIKGRLSEIIRAGDLSREQIADRMSLLTGTKVTERRINAFTAESREDFRFPLELLRAFCVATGDFSLIQQLAESLGLHLITEQESALLDLGREYLRQKRASENVAKLEQRLRGVDL